MTDVADLDDRLISGEKAAEEMARPTGFEPATFGSGGRRSIH